MPEVLTFKDAKRLVEWNMPVFGILYFQNRTLRVEEVFFEKEEHAVRWSNARTNKPTSWSVCPVEACPTNNKLLQLRTKTGRTIVFG